MSKTNTTPAEAISQSQIWDDRIKSAAQIMGLSETEVTEGLASENIGILKSDIETLGYSEVMNDKTLRFQDFSSYFTKKGIRIALIRIALEKLIEKAEAGERNLDARSVQLKQAFGYDIKISDSGNEQLLQHYKHGEINDPVSRELKKRYGNNKVVAINPSTNEVAIPETIDLMDDFDRHGKVSEFVEVNHSGLVKPVAIGELSNITMDEDPLYPGKVLNKGRSEVNYIKWTDIDKKERQFCRLVADAKLVNLQDRSAAFQLLKTATDGFSSLEAHYPEIAAQFRELEKLETLPTLKVRIEQGKGTKQNPFAIPSRASNHRSY